MVGLGIELRQDQWDKISDESLTFILSESDTYLQETITSFREVVNRCYYTIGVYFALFAYSATELIKLSESNSFKYIPYSVILLGALTGIILILYTLLPKKMMLIGTQAKYLLQNEFLKLSGNKQIREYKIQTIINSNDGCEKNNSYTKENIKFFKISIYVVIFSIALSGALFLWIVWRS